MVRMRELAQLAWKTYRMGGAKTLLNLTLSYLETRWLLLYHGVLDLGRGIQRDVAAIKIVAKQAGDESSLEMLRYLVPQLNRMGTIHTPNVVVPNYLFHAFSLARPILSRGRLRLARMDEELIPPDVFVCNRSMVKQVSCIYSDHIRTLEVVFENGTYVIMATPSLFAPTNSNFPMSSEYYVQAISCNQTEQHLAHIRRHGFEFVIRSGTMDEVIIDEVRDEYVSRLQEDGFFGQNVVDLGAHIGAFSIQVTQFLSRTTAKVISVEPSPYNHELLQENLRLNQLEHIVDLRRVAVSARYNVSGPVGQKLREKGVGRTRGF